MEPQKIVVTITITIDVREETPEIPPVATETGDATRSRLSF